MSREQDIWYLGTSGWAHRDWVGILYAHDLAPSEYLTTYARQFNTVEIEHTFFEMPTRQTVQSWQRRTPEGFVFSPCLPRRITHQQRLRDTQSLLEDFIETINELRDKLGPILVQLPEDFRSIEQESLEAFFSNIPQQVELALVISQGGWV